MKIFKIIFWILWRLWFYILILIAILLLLPFLLVCLIREKDYPHFFVVVRVWSKIVLYGMGFYPKIETEEPIDPYKNYIFVANHTSMIDIMLMLVVVKNPFIFVGKKELAKIPIFSFFYKRTSILVDRASLNSRKTVYVAAQKRIDSGLSICIFPEGGVPDENVFLDDFKEGAFRLANHHQLPIKPITFGDNKEKFSYTFFSGSMGKLRVKIHQAIGFLPDTPESRKQLKTFTRAVIYKQLEDFEIEKNSF
jgi:1-acyl-sn-glycerol-3-phosphate acyltransferase